MLTVSLIATPLALTFINRRYSVDRNRHTFLENIQDMYMYIIYTTLGQSN